jgi:hypothetical protein
MDTTCGRLTRGENYFAWFDSSNKRLVISADVELNPVTSVAHICPNPLARLTPPPEAREFLLEVADKPHGPIVPPLLVKTRVTASFAMDAAPARVRLFVMGIDNPASQDLQVQSAPPPPLPQPASAVSPSASAAAPSPPKRGTSIDVIGHSQSFSLDEALKDALAQLAQKLPFHNPDVAIQAHVEKIDARSGGNILPGLFVTVRGSV